MPYDAQGMRQYREDHPEYMARQRLQARARHKARRELALKHPEEFERLYRASLSEMRGSETGSSSDAETSLSQRREETRIIGT